jgi:hypothetical protein
MDDSFKNVMAVVLVELLCQWAPPILNLKLTWKRRPVPPLQSDLILGVAFRLYYGKFYATAGRLLSLLPGGWFLRKTLCGGKLVVEGENKNTWPRMGLDCCISKFTINSKGTLLYEDPRPFLLALAQQYDGEQSFYFAFRVLREYHLMHANFRGPRGDPTEVLFRHLLEPCKKETKPHMLLELTHKMRKLANDWPKASRKFVLGLCTHLNSVGHKEALVALLPTALVCMSISESFDYGSFAEFDMFMVNFKVWLEKTSPLSAAQSRKLTHRLLHLATSANHKLSIEIAYALRLILPAETRILFRAVVEDLFNLILQRLPRDAPDSRYNFFDYTLTKRIPHCYLVRKFMHKHPNTYYTLPIRTTFLEAGRVGSHFMEMLQDLESSILGARSLAEICAKVHIDDPNSSLVHLAKNDEMTLYALQAMRLMMRPTKEHFEKVAARMDPDPHARWRPSMLMLDRIHKSLPYQFDLRFYNAFQPVYANR